MVAISDCPRSGQGRWRPSWGPVRGHPNGPAIDPHQPWQDHGQSQIAATSAVTPNLVRAGALNRLYELHGQEATRLGGPSTLRFKRFGSLSNSAEVGPTLLQIFACGFLGTVSDAAIVDLWSLCLCALFRAMSVQCRQRYAVSATAPRIDANVGGLLLPARGYNVAQRPAHPRTNMWDTGYTVYTHALAVVSTLSVRRILRPGPRDVWCSTRAGCCTDACFSRRTQHLGLRSLSGLRLPLTGHRMHACYSPSCLSYGVAYPTEPFDVAEIYAAGTDF